MSSRQFSIPTVLRMVPNKLLLALFRGLGYPELDTDWDRLKEHEIDPIQKAISTRSREEQIRIESELRSIFELAWNPGIESILEAASLLGIDGFAAELPQEAGVYHKSIWTRLNHPVVFEKALRIHSFESLNWWRKRNDLPTVTFQVDDPVEAKLGEALSELFYHAQGRGFPCTVEQRFSREDGTVYFYAHPDDFAWEAMTHDDAGTLMPVTVRTTFSVVFAYNSTEGALELHAKVSAKLKRELERVFSETLLKFKPGPWDPGAAYELNVLKNRALSLAPDFEDRVRIQVRKMRLSAKNTGRRATVEVADDDDNIHRAIDEWINLKNLPLEEVNVTQVTFRFEFLELEGRKHGSETFDVTYPSSCNLKGRPPERVAIIEKYLKRWKIDARRPSVVDAGPVGPDSFDLVGVRA